MIPSARGRRMLAIAGWTTSSLMFAALVLSTFQLDHVPLPIPLSVVALTALAVVLPLRALGIFAVLMPIVSYTAARGGLPPVAWPQILAVAVAAGWSIRRTVWHDRDRVDARVTVPAFVFATAIVCACGTALAVEWFRLGPAFAPALADQLTGRHLSGSRTFPALPAALIALEGLVLAVMTAATVTTPAALRSLASAVVVGAAIAAGVNIWRLAEAPLRADAFWDSFIRAVRATRYNAHFDDKNAAASQFAMVALLAVGVASAGSVARRIGWALSAVTTGLGLWITGSRAGMVAVLVAAVPVVARRSPRATIYGLAAAIALGVVVFTLSFGTRPTASTALRSRWELLVTGLTMTAANPVFGVGLGEFVNHSGQFSSPELIALFPPSAVGENAHNNFTQISAEQGIPTALVFVWLLAAGLVLGRRAMNVTGDRLSVCLFAALIAFVVTCLGGHPLLSPEPGYTFWILFGAAAGTGRVVARPAGAREQPAPLALSPALAGAALALVALALIAEPFRIRGAVADANFEHQGIGVSGWRDAGDGVRYRAATDRAVLFVPARSALRLRVRPKTTEPVRLQLTLAGRPSDVVQLLPDEWNEVTLLPRSIPSGERFSRLELDLAPRPDSPVTLWITKVDVIATR